MNAVDSIRLITLRELKARGQTKAYLLSAVFLLLLITGAILLPQLLGGGGTTYQVGTLGEGNQQILDLTRTIGTREAGDEEFVLDVQAFESEDDARLALAEGDVDLVLVDGAEILRQGTAGFSGSDTQDTVQRAASVSRLDGELAGTGIDPDQIASIFDGNPLPVRAVEGSADADVETARSIIAYAGMFLLYLAILIYGNWTLQGIAEEKTSRIVEVLLSTVKPWHLLTGKILGIGLLGVAQFTVTIVWGLLMIRVTDVFRLPTIPVDSAVALIVWFILGFASFSVMYAMAGSLVSRMEDAQSVSFPITAIAMIGFFVSFGVLDEPSGLVARIATFVPFVSPYVVPIRVAYQEIALWEYLTSILVTLATIVVLVRIAARVYARGLLHFGGTLSLRNAFRSADAPGQALPEGG